MNISSLKSQIQTGNFDSVYVFTGEEVKIMDIYINMIAKKANLSIVRTDALSEVYQQIKTKTLIQQSFLYLIRDDKDYLTDVKLQEKLTTVPNNNIIIFYYTEIDKRTKFWKERQDDIVLFNPLEKNVLLKYIKKEIDLSDENCERLIDICEKNYSRILLEIDKIKQYGEWSQVINENKIFELLVDDGTISTPPHDAIFDFANAVMERNPKKAWSLLQQSYEVGEANMVLLSVLYTNIKQLLLVQSCYRENLNIVETTGMNGFQIKSAKSYVNNYRNGELVKMMRYIRKAERGIKTGEIPDDISVQYVLVNCM